MHAKPMISVVVTNGPVDAIARQGGSPVPILRKCGSERSDLTNPENFISAKKLAQLLEERKELGRKAGDRRKAADRPGDLNKPS